jgi:hypothetical protein
MTSPFSTGEIADVDFSMRMIDPAELPFRMLPMRLARSHSHSPAEFCFELASTIRANSGT